MSLHSEDVVELFARNEGSERRGIGVDIQIHVDVFALNTK